MRPQPEQRTNASSGNSITPVLPSEPQTGQQSRKIVRATASAVAGMGARYKERSRRRNPRYAPRLVRPALPMALLTIAGAAACRPPGGFAPRPAVVGVRAELEPLLRAVRAAPDDRAAGEAWNRHIAQV